MVSTDTRNGSTEHLAGDVSSKEDGTVVDDLSRAPDKSKGFLNFAETCKKGIVCKGDLFAGAHCLYRLPPRGFGKVFHHPPDWLHAQSGNDEEGESDGEREWYSNKICFHRYSVRLDRPSPRRESSDGLAI